ncbi:MAG: UDP-N-acetylmuramoyl-tripeptide--D-alanyl-D-alanine ligase [Planctomycetaceae bacterium]|nr:UDP-N-acetylmuramoyl-tripeptide--D-alanyl-D-alanine ligase [Planctomycetaceae bacterium]
MTIMTPRKAVVSTIGPVGFNEPFDERRSSVWNDRDGSRPHPALLSFPLRRQPAIDENRTPMPSVTLSQFLALTNGQLLGDADLSATIAGCSIDSRTVQPGEAFFALPGSSDHGIHFADDAAKNGAVCAVVDRSVGVATECPQVIVDDAEYALAQLAHHHRSQLDTLVIGITGSVGKTTTRRLIHAVLSAAGSGQQSPRNYNNTLGVPLSLLQLTQDDEFAAIEVATSQPGEIAYLASVARPEMGVLTRIAPAHLDGLASLEDIRQEKTELLRALPADGVGFVNIDDPLLRSVASELSCRVVTFGEDPLADVRASEVACENDRLSVAVNGVTYDVSVFGRHHVTNVLAAIAVGLEVGLSPEAIQAGLAQFQSQAGRCNWETVGPWTVIDDAYNASPVSVTALAQSLQGARSNGRRIMVLGDMLGLGDQSLDLHYAVGGALAACSVDHILTCGQFSDSLVEGFRSAGGHISRISRFNDLDTLNSLLSIMAAPGDLIAVKGSRSTRMERVVQYLRQSAADAPLRRAA